MKIIMLAGESNAGKTTALNQLYERLVKDEKIEILKKRKPLGWGPNDFSAIVKYKNKTTAIVSAGDTLRETIKAIVQYAYCDILVIGYNTRFAIALDEVVEEKNNHHCAIRKKKPTDNDNNRVIGEIMKAVRTGL